MRSSRTTSTPGRPLRVRFATTNPGKFREATELLAPFGVRLLWSRRPLVEVQADRLEEVVRAKLGSLPVRGGWDLVEDSGLFLPGLGGFPGVYSSYIYRIWGLDPILELLRRRPRAAVFRTVAGLRRGRVTRLFSGECPGEIVPRARGTGGFGFDPVFRPKGDSRTFAEMTTAEKNRFSHRARALAKAGRFLAKVSA